MANPCPLWSLLLRKFALGKMSAIEVQEVASAAVKSGAATPEMIELQKLGTFGLTKGNCNRDLMRKYFGKMAAPDPWKQACLLQVKEQGQLEEKVMDSFLLLPHQWSLALEAAEMLAPLTCTNEELRVFWESQKKSPQMSPAMWKSLDFNHPSTLPLPWCLHGDSAPFTEADSLQVLSMRCLLTKRPIGESQLLLTAIPKAALTKGGWQKLMETVAWSFSCLREGVAPKKDVEGKKMERERGKKFRKGWLWAITGDLEFFASEFGFPYPGANELCAWCKADQNLSESTHPYTDFRACASWRGTVLSPSQLMAKWGSHCLFKSEGISPSTVKLDLLHTLDLGVAAYMHGSVLVEVMNTFDGRSCLALLEFFFFGGKACITMYEGPTQDCIQEASLFFGMGLLPQCLS